MNSATSRVSPAGLAGECMAIVTPPSAARISFRLVMAMADLTPATTEGQGTGGRRKQKVTTARLQGVLPSKLAVAKRLDALDYTRRNQPRRYIPYARRYIRRV